MNRKFLLSLSSSLVLLNSSIALSAYGQPAGSILESTTTTPYASLEPEKDLTSFFDFGANSNTSKKQVHDDVLFSADFIESNQELETITAHGDVQIIRENLTLEADKVIYNQKDDIINAVGNVVILEADGSVIFAEFVELTQKLTQGEMKNIKLIMKDESRLSARRIRRIGNDKKIMDNALYTPCNVCKSKNPLWQLKAKKVTHNAETKDVYYNGATLEVKGVPVFYTPFLSHPDPTVKRRSGFLTPKIGSNSYLGATFQPNYFWDISDQEDLTFSPILTSSQGLVIGGEYNKYTAKGNISLNGSFLSEKEDDKKTRGNLFLKGRYEINDYWVASTDINYASDINYLKDLSLPKNDDAWLESNIRLQGFDNRNYAAIEAYYYKILSNDIKSMNKPLIMPLFTYENISTPDAYGAYTKNILNFASVFRDDDNSSQRATMINSWNLPYISPYGERYKLSASVKSDLYYIDNYQPENEPEFSGATARIMPNLGLEWRMPFVRSTQTSRQILEPVLLGVLAPNSDNGNNKIPNDDSQDIALDDTNILNIDRYTGYDRNDIGSRISYGVNWNAYGEHFGRTSMFIAQSYNFDQNDDDFLTAAGVNNNFSDYVGRIYAAPNQYVDLDYRFRLNKDDLQFTYNELNTTIGPKILNANISYIYLQEDKNFSSYNNEERKELYTSVNAMLSKDWSINVYNRQDLAENGGSLEYGGSLIYEDECLKLIGAMSKDNSDDEEYEGDFEMTVSFILKTLGGAGSK